MKRRDFLKSTAAFSLTMASMDQLLTSPAYASTGITVGENDYKTLLCLNLNGGNDSFNMLTPLSNAEHAAYYSARPNLAFEQNQLLPISPSNYDANSFGINPNMPGLRDMFANGDASFIANVGALIEPATKAEILDPDSGIQLPNNLGSHNTQTFYWQGDHDNSASSSQDGWGARLAKQFTLDGLLPTNIAIGSGYRLFHAHDTQKFYSINLDGLITPRDFDVNTSNNERRARRDAIRRMYELAANSSNPYLKHTGQLSLEGQELNASLQNIIADIDAEIPDLISRFPPANNANGNALRSAFAQAAKYTLARQSLGMKRQILFVEAAGYDTHGSQLERHSILMTDLSNFLKAYNDIIKENGLNDSVMSITTSEFGRTLSANEDGTDHGWGASHIVMGGAIEGGKIIGDFPTLVLGSDDDINDAGRIIPTQSVSQYGATLSKWLGVPDEKMEEIFPNLANFGTNRYLDFLKP